MNIPTIAEIVRTLGDDHPSALSFGGTPGYAWNHNLEVVQYLPPLQRGNKTRPNRGVMSIASSSDRFILLVEGTRHLAPVPQEGMAGVADDHLDGQVIMVVPERGKLWSVWQWKVQMTREGGWRRRGDTESQLVATTDHAMAAAMEVANREWIKLVMAWCEDADTWIWGYPRPTPRNQDGA